MENKHMTDWKKTYSTWLLAATAVLGAVNLALQSLTGSGVDIPTWVLPVIGAVGVFLRALPQGGASE